MTAEPIPLRPDPRVADLAVRRRRLDGQLAVLRGHERRLSEQVHAAREQGRRPEYVREIVQRRLAVRARLEEVEFRRSALEAEQQARRPR